MNSRLSLWVRAVVFTLLVPCTVAVLIPSLLSRFYDSSIGLGELNVIGIPFLLVGILLYLVSIAAFITKGRGTPAIWFSRFLAPLIGNEPDRLVAAGLYRWTRNPMYLAVILIVLGQGLFLDFLIYHFYAVALWLFFHAVVTGLEEPHLKKKFERPYEEYLKKTPRWIGFSPDPPDEGGST